MKGDIVFVRDAGGRPLVRRVWDETDNTVYICSQDRYIRLLMKREGELPPFGFPIENVYKYDPKIEKVLLDSYEKDPSIWERLTPYNNERYALT